MSKPTENTSNTGKKQERRKLPVEAEPYQFKKGDPRINRKGRPRKADMLRAALLEKWDAPLLNKDGKPAQVNPATGKPLTYGESVIERLYRDPKQAPELLNRAFGKVRDQVDIDLKDERTTQEHDMSKLTDDDLRTLSALQAKARTKDD